MPSRVGLTQIKDRFEQKKKSRPRYSLRSYARDLGVSPALLSLVLSGKRKPSAHLILKFLESEPVAVAAATATAVSSKNHRHDYINPQFLKIAAPLEIEHWYEIALLDLLVLAGQETDSAWLSQKLGISLKKVTEALEKLETLKLIDIERSKIKKQKSKISIQTTQSLENIRNIHRGFIGRALEELNASDSAAFAKRNISATTITANPKRIEQAKKRVDHFQQELTDFLSEGKCTTLYQLNVQLFPLIK